MPIIFLTGHSDTERCSAPCDRPAGLPAQAVPGSRAALPRSKSRSTSIAPIAQLRERGEALRRNAELLQNLSLIDELTQLKNRRGFFELAEQALKVAHREHYVLGLFFMDLNGLKQINDTLGHLSGDQALRDAADVLRHTFRDSDIVARLGGDEFVALAHVHATQDMSALGARLREHLREFNDTHDRPFELDFSIGMTAGRMPIPGTTCRRCSRRPTQPCTKKRAA